MPDLLTKSSTIKLTPDAGWSWRGWDGVVTLAQGLDTVLADGNAIALDQHLILALSQVAAKPYEAMGFADVPGMIATVVGTLDDGTLAENIEAGPSRPALSTTTGTFTAIVGTPSSRLTPGGPVPDTVPVKSGTWQVEFSAQESVMGT
jgi:hypothetical protein